MLTIRRDQVDKLAVPDEASLIEFIMDFLRRDCADYVEGIPVPSLERMVQTGLSRARRYEFSAPEDLAAYVGTMFQIAPNFDQHPEIHAVLSDPIIPAGEKFDKLTQPRFDQAWDEADENYDPEAWLSEA